jgi:hypothetical protein
MTQILIIPAYGRKYLNKEDLLKDWDSGKDFKLCGGPYLSVRDIYKLKEDGISTVNFSYANYEYFSITI